MGLLGIYNEAILSEHPGQRQDVANWAFWLAAVEQVGFGRVMVLCCCQQPLPAAAAAIDPGQVMMLSAKAPTTTTNKQLSVRVLGEKVSVSSVASRRKPKLVLHHFACAVGCW